MLSPDISGQVVKVEIFERTGQLSSRSRRFTGYRANRAAFNPPIACSLTFVEVHSSESLVRFPEQLDFIGEALRSRKPTSLLLFLAA